MVRWAKMLLASLEMLVELLFDSLFVFCNIANSSGASWVFSATPTSKSHALACCEFPLVVEFCDAF